MDWWIVVIFIAQLAFVAFLIAISVSHRQKTLARRSEERLRVLERFGSGQELAEFLSTERGSQFLQLFAVKTSNPARFIVTGVATAILLGFAGGAFLLLSWLDAQDLGVEYMVAAVLVLAGAFGILSASVVSLRLVRKLGLVPPDSIHPTASGTSG